MLFLKNVITASIVIIYISAGLHCKLLVTQCKQIEDKANSKVVFSKGSARIRAKEKIKLDSIVSIMLQDKWQEILLVGNSSSFDNKKKALKISAKRSDKVNKYLLSKGISTSRIYIENFGSKNAIQKTDIISSKFQKDMVELILFKD